MRRAADIGMSVLFLYAVAVQYNDPDPISWMAVYGAAAVISAVIAFRRAPMWVPIGLGAIALPWAGIVATRVIGLRDLVDSEEGREMLGLLIVAVWMGVLAYRSRSPRTK